jgi:MFS family permease
LIVFMNMVRLRISSAESLRFGHAYPPVVTPVTSVRATSNEMTSEKFLGWRVVAGCFIVLTTSTGLGFYGLAVYLNALSNERGWDVSSISLATTWFFFVGGVVGVWAARLIANHDVRHVSAAGGVIGGIALASLGQVTQQWQLFVVYGVFATGWSLAGLVPMTTVVTRWFHARRSVALSVASTGLSAGGILITPAAKWLLDRRGLEAGTPWLGLLFVIGIVPVVYLLITPDPAPTGWLPDGERAHPGVVAPALTGTRYRDAIASRFFIFVTIGYVLALGSQVGAIQQLVKLVEERTTADTAALATLVLAATSVIARLIGGRVVASIPMIPFTAALAALQMVALVALGFAETAPAMFGSIVLFGATVGNILMLQPLLIAERFGVRDYPKIYSRAQLFGLVGTAGGPILLGWLHDLSGGYRASYIAAGCLSLTGAAVISMSGSTTAPAEQRPEVEV